MDWIKDLRVTNYRLAIAEILCVLSIACVAAMSAKAQSISIEYPTPVSTNEINGKINARDVGDSRLTSYFYTFNGSQGDIFINVSAANFNGDIDVFIADGLRPLTKISFYADSSVSETGRVVYLRKPEKLVLRVQGRTPDDSPATFTIKFAGSFVAVQSNGMPDEPAIPTVKSEDTGGLRVNSVGTIIRPEPKPTPEAGVAERKEEEPKEVEKTAETTPKVVTSDNTETAKNDEADKPAEVKTDSEKEVVAKTPKRRTPVRNTRNNTTTRRTTPVKPKPAPKTPVKTVNPDADASATTTTTTPATKAPKPNPLENVHMIVLKKDGEKIELPMTEVFRFTMNNNVLTIVTKDGKIQRHSILDIQKFTIE